MDLISGLKEEWYKPDENDLFEVLLKPLDQLDWVDCDSLTGKGDLSGAIRKALSSGIKDWRGVLLEGKEVSYSREHLSKISRSILYQIYTRLSEISTMSEDDEKN